MGIQDSDPTRPTFERRGQTFDSAIAEVYGGPQSRENFVIRPSEVRKVLNYPVDKNSGFQDYKIRKKLGIVNSTWYSRRGMLVDDLEAFIEELARRKGQKFKMRKAAHYANIFRQIACEMGDDGITFRSANILLGNPIEKRWQGDGKPDLEYGYHPLDKVYKPILKTRIASLQEVKDAYERQA